MNIKVQITIILFSIIYGIIIENLIKINKKSLNPKHFLLKIIISLLFSINICLIYIVFLININDGVLYFKNIIFVLIGYFLSKNVKFNN